MLRYKVLTFDINKTLIKVRHSVGQQYAKVASQFSVDVDADDLERVYRTHYKDQNQKHPNFGATTGLTSEQWWSEIVHRSFHQIGFTQEETLAKISTKLYNDFKKAPSWEVYPEVQEMLTFFNKNGVCLGVISNMDERLMPILQATDLARHFAFILPSIYAGCHKPDPRIFRQVLEHLRIQDEPQNCAHIGDSVKKDYNGARGIGMDAFVVDRDGELNHSKEIPKEHVLKDLTELESKIFLNGNKDSGM